MAGPFCTKSKPSVAGSIWKGGARERARNDQREFRGRADFATTCLRRPYFLFAQKVGGKTRQRASPLETRPRGVPSTPSARPFCKVSPRRLAPRARLLDGLFLPPGRDRHGPAIVAAHLGNAPCVRAGGGIPLISPLRVQLPPRGKPKPSPQGEGGICEANDG